MMVSFAGVGGIDWQRAHKSILGCWKGSNLDGGHIDTCNNSLSFARTHVVYA